MAISFLMSKKTPLLKLSMENGRAIEIFDLINREKLPVFLKERSLNTANLNKWIEKRIIPKNREGLDFVKENFENFDQFGSMFSLTDQYWFKFSNKEIWEDGNFFYKRYDRNFGYMFFYPWQVERKSIGLPSPDMTTNGVTKKRWIQYKGDFKSYLIKCRDKQGKQDPINEVIASKFLKNLKFIDIVDYDLIVDGLRFCSKCKNFIDENTEFVPASHLFSDIEKENSTDYYDIFIEKCKKMEINGAEDYLNRMITADYLVKNHDRHFGNFGFIRDVNENKILGFAPLFDFGSSFTNDENKNRHFFEDEKIKNALEYTKKKYNISLDKAKKDSLLEVLNYYPFHTNKIDLF